MLNVSDYREWMKSNLKERMDTNPSYSLRAFARDLKLSPASISLVLNGRKGLSKLSAERVAQHMGLNPSEQEYFKALVITQHGRTPVARQQARTRIADIALTTEKHSLEADQFQVIANWYHFAILQLTHLKGFKSEVAWIAKQLDITEADCREALARLKRLKLLEVKPSGKLVTSKRIVFTKDNVPSQALRKFHRQMIEKGIRAIQEQDIENRTLISSLLPIKRSHYPKIAKKIRELNEEIIQHYTTTHEDAEAVYGIAFQLYQVNQRETP